MKNIDIYQDKIGLAYRGNADFLERLAKAYQFEVFVFIQPLGNLTEANPMLMNRDALKESGMTTTIGAIRKKKINPHIVKYV